MDSAITANESADKIMTGRKTSVYACLEGAAGVYVETVGAPGVPVFVGLVGARWSRRSIQTRPTAKGPLTFTPYDAGFAAGYAAALALCKQHAADLKEL